MPVYSPLTAFSALPHKARSWASSAALVHLHLHLLTLAVGTQAQPAAAAETPKPRNGRQWSAQAAGNCQVRSCSTYSCKITLNIAQ
jgi:hypothetical protein